jgi:hypothetical protein
VAVRRSFLIETVLGVLVATMRGSLSSHVTVLADCRVPFSRRRLAEPLVLKIKPAPRLGNHFMLRGVRRT